MIYVIYRKKNNAYEIRIENPFAKPAVVDFEIWSNVLRKYGRSLNGETSLSGSISVESEDLVGIV